VKIQPEFFFANLASGELQKCVWTSWQTASLLDTKIIKMGPEFLSWTSRGENFQNASELHDKQLHFWTHESW